MICPVDDILNPKAYVNSKSKSLTFAKSLGSSLKMSWKTPPVTWSQTPVSESDGADSSLGWKQPLAGLQKQVGWKQPAAGDRQVEPIEPL